MQTLTEQVKPRPLVIPSVHRLRPSQAPTLDVKVLHAHLAKRQLLFLSPCDPGPLTFLLLLLLLPHLSLPGIAPHRRCLCRCSASSSRNQRQTTRVTNNHDALLLLMLLLLLLHESSKVLEGHRQYVGETKSARHRLYILPVVESN